MQEQATGTEGTGRSREELQSIVENRLHPRNFTEPGPLWWAFNWKTAAERMEKLGKQPPPAPSEWSRDDGGVVVLIDEIDKADGTVPNGLLGALGSGWFDEPGETRVKVNRKAEPPLVVLTTNEERVLPDAFVRRCIVLQIDMGDVRTSEGEERFSNILRERGRAHFRPEDVPDDVLDAVAGQLVEDRRVLIERRLGLPGTAEYIDLLWGLTDMTAAIQDPMTRQAKQKELLERLATFVFDKHPPRVS